MPIEPGKSYTFTLSSVPQRSAQRKTIHRLMCMQPEVQRGLSKLARRRRQTDNITYIRAGRPWTNRARTTKLTNLAEGERFTIHVTPQIVNDLHSVESFLKAAKAK